MVLNNPQAQPSPMRCASDSRTSLIVSRHFNKPVGIRIFGSCFQFGSPSSKRTFHKTLVLFMTFLAYAAFHMGRRPISAAKPIFKNDYSIIGLEGNSTKIAGFEFANLLLLGSLDSAFLLSYAISMFFSGIIAERTNLRYFITIGCLLSGISLIAFGLAEKLNIHSFYYFLVIQLFSGAFQSTGWPIVVTCVGNWFEPSKRGTVYGFWNSHTNLGNILGVAIAGALIEFDWGLAFTIPGVIMLIVAYLLFLFLVPEPRDVELESIDGNPDMSRQSEKNVTSASINSSVDTKAGTSYPRSAPQEVVLHQSQDSNKAVSFWTALKIPGVIEYSICLFFSKLVNYTFLYWLPNYISTMPDIDPGEASFLSIPFDVGGALGAVIAGVASDWLGVNGLICNVMLILSIPSLFVYEKYGGGSTIANIMLSATVGLLVNGPYCLITTSVSADLGSRIKDGRAMATVAAIIDGMGSIGSVLGPLLAGYLQKDDDDQDWTGVFLMLMISDILASLCLVRLSLSEIRGKCLDSSRSDTSTDSRPQNSDWFSNSKRKELACYTNEASDVVEITGKSVSLNQIRG